MPLSQVPICPFLPQLSMVCHISCDKAGVGCIHHIKKLYVKFDTQEYFVSICSIREPDVTTRLGEIVYVTDDLTWIVCQEFDV